MLPASIWDWLWASGGYGFFYLDPVPLVVWRSDADESDVDLASVDFRRRRLPVNVVHEGVESGESQETRMTGLLNENVA